MSDLWAIINSTHFEIEVKAGSGVLSKPQKAWRNTCSIIGAVFIEARSVEQTISEIKTALVDKARTEKRMKSGIE